MAEDGKTVVRRFFDETNAGNLSAIDELLADDFTEHEEFPGIEQSREGVKQFFMMFRSAFPDMHMDAHEMVAEGDMVCVRATMAGTQQGEFMGMPPSGKHFEVEGFDMCRVRDGRIVDHWGLFDSMAMMQQLGAMPAEEMPA